MKQFYLMSRSQICQVQTYLCFFFLLEELSEDSFSVGVHQQVFAVHTEIHHPWCRSCHSLFTEALRHLAVSTSQQKHPHDVTVRWLVNGFTKYIQWLWDLETYSYYFFTCQGSVCWKPRPGSAEVSAGRTHFASKTFFCRGCTRRERW